MARVGWFWFVVLEALRGSSVLGWMLGSFLVQVGLCGGRGHALACLLALNGLRISEALGADIDDLDRHCGHRTLFIHRNSGKTATIPPSPHALRERSISPSTNASLGRSS